MAHLREMGLADVLYANYEQPPRPTNVANVVFVDVVLLAVAMVYHYRVLKWNMA